MKTVSTDDSSESEPSRVCTPWHWWGEQGSVRVGTAVGNKTLADWELWGAKCCPAQRSGKWAVWHGRSSFWGFVHHCFPLSWAQEWEMLAVGASPTILLLSWGPHGVWEWLPPGLRLEKRGASSTGMDAILSLSQSQGTTWTWPTGSVHHFVFVPAATWN